MVEDWIDALTAAWAVTDGTLNGAVRSFNMISSNDFPEAITAEMLSQNPIALTFPPSLSPQYSRRGAIAIWSGETEFHLAPDFSNQRIGKLLPWYLRIWNAAAADPQLGGKVELFWIPEQDNALSRLSSLQYGDEAQHWGIVVQWKVKEHVDAQITVGGPS